MIEDGLGFYDVIIDIESFNDLKSKENNTGWKILMSEKGNEKYEYFSNINTSNEDNKDTDLAKKHLNRIGILGVSNVGKTFILKKLINKKENIPKKTRGISVIYPEIKTDNYFVCIDSQGSEEPIIDKNKTEQEVFDLTEEQRKVLIKELSRDKNFTEIFIQDFIIKKSNILIVVVDQLTFSEQKLINRLKYNTNFKKLFVIHNTQFFEEVDVIEKHIENVIKKSIFSNLEKASIPNLNQNSETGGKAYYFKEKEFGNEDNNQASKQEIIHLFMAKENSNAGKYFNDQTIEYIRYLIKAETRTKIFDVIKEIKDFLSFNSILYMIKEDKDKRPIEKDDIEKKNENEGNYLKCKKDFKLKDCVINEMGISNFTTENSINPSFVCYKGRYINKKKNEDWPALIIKTEMFINVEDIEKSQEISDDNETMNLILSCKKKFDKVENVIEQIGDDIDGSDIKEGIIRINIQFSLNNFRLDNGKKPQVREPFPGIKLIYLKIDDKHNKNENVIEKETKKKVKEKINK